MAARLGIAYRPRSNSATTTRRGPAIANPVPHRPSMGIVLIWALQLYPSRDNESGRMAGDTRRPWTQIRRFEFIEWKLFWEGVLNRNDLEETFDISTPQASVDIRKYRSVASSNITYDLTEKAYRPTTKFKPRFLAISADRLLLQMRAWLAGTLPRAGIWFRNIPAVDVAPDLARHVDADILRRAIAAMAERKAIHVRYQSLTNSRWRWIAPHALAFDGHRWHLRAWACDRADFRDFVITRIDDIGETRTIHVDPDDDLLWTRTCTLCLYPHPALSPDQKEAIQRDYGMENGILEVETRLSMAYYFIRRMNLDLENLPPERVQVQLQNLGEIEGAIEAARIATRQRTQDRAVLIDVRKRET